jgi:hypothetical protein
MNVNRSADASGDAPRPQMLLLMAGAVAGIVLLAAALTVELTGANDPRAPAMPAHVRPTMPDLPTTLPGVPGSTGMPTQLPTDFPTDFPTRPPTEMPSLPTGLPGIPQLPGGAP